MSPATLDAADLADIRSILARIEPMLARVSEQQRTLAEQQQTLAEQQQTLAAEQQTTSERLRKVELDLAELKGRVSQLPTTVQLIGFVFAVLLAGGLLKRFVG